MNLQNLQPSNCTKNISGCRAQLLGNTSLVECHEEDACRWSASLGHLKFCEHPSARLAASCSIQQHSIGWVN